jgi:hypothetical protein
MPYFNKTHDECMNDMKYDPYALCWVPEEEMTVEMCMMAVRYWGITAFNEVPDKFKTEEMCMIAVSLDGSCLKIIPKNLQTLEMQLEAVRKDFTNMRFVNLDSMCMEKRKLFREAMKHHFKEV